MTVVQQRAQSWFTLWGQIKKIFTKSFIRCDASMISLKCKIIIKIILLFLLLKYVYLSISITYITQNISNTDNKCSYNVLNLCPIDFPTFCYREHHSCNIGKRKTDFTHHTV